tara:strand:- start:855 stop:1193 length:339 start_codon:yes stop_codon:yes gene_type:complete
MSTPNYIDANYRNQLKDELKESIFNTLKGPAPAGNIRDPSESIFTLVNGVITGSPTITMIDPLEPLRDLSEELANIIDVYVTERIYLEILGSEIEDGKLQVTGTLADKLNNA